MPSLAVGVPVFQSLERFEAIRVVESLFSSSGLMTVSVPLRLGVVVDPPEIATP